MKSNDDYTAKNAAVLAREERKYEKALARRDSLERNMQKSLTAMIKAGKKTLSREAATAVNKGESGNLSANERAIVEAGLKSINNGYDEFEVAINEGVITGFDEQKAPWIRDDEDY